MKMRPTPKELFSPFTMGGLLLDNRVVLAPLTRARAGASRLANALMAGYYAQRAGAGLLIAEATTISPQANGWVGTPAMRPQARLRMRLTHHEENHVAPSLSARRYIRNSKE